ncbi:MAG: DUF308 domain-containing protein [Microbacteriaceae bacterium]
MPGSQNGKATPADYWPIPLARAVPALLLGLFITFSANHSPQVGLLAFGAFGLLTGVLLTVFSLLRLRDSGTRLNFFIQGAVTGIAGLLALFVHSSGLIAFLYLLGVFAALTGFLELYSGFRSRGRSILSRDWLNVGGLTVVLAVVLLVVPPDAVFAVGMLGAYGIVLGVYLTIAGLSLRWGLQDNVPVIVARARRRP